MRIRFRLFVLLLLPFSLAAKPAVEAEGAWADTIRYSLSCRPKFFLNLTTSYTFISDELVNLSGFRMGLNYNRRIKFGTGFFSLRPNKVVSTIEVMEDTMKTVTNGKLEASFFSITTEYIFFNDFPWQFSVFPVDLGIGGAHYRYLSQRGDGRWLETPDVALVFYQPSVTAQYSLFQWLGVSAAIGYRFTLYSSKELREDFSSPLFSAGIKLFLDEAYRSVFPDGLRVKKQ